jgi:COMPASS component SPP1
MSDNDWGKAYNASLPLLYAALSPVLVSLLTQLQAADSQLYKQHGSNAKLSKADRVSGKTRLLALARCGRAADGTLLTAAPASNSNINPTISSSSTTAPTIQAATSSKTAQPTKEMPGRKPKPGKADKRSAAGTESDSASDAELYCICNKPDDHTPMICCEGCDLWHHAHCVGISGEDANNGRMIDFYCPSCTDISKDRRTHFRAFCHLEGCDLFQTNVEEFGRFCSKDHAKEWARTMIMTHARFDDEPSIGGTLNINEVALLFKGVKTMAELKARGEQPTLNVDKHLQTVENAESASEVEKKVVTIDELRARITASKLTGEPTTSGEPSTDKGKEKANEDIEEENPDGKKIHEVFDYDSLLNADELEEVGKIVTKRKKIEDDLEGHKFRFSLLKPIKARNTKIMAALGHTTMCGAELRLLMMDEHSLAAWKKTSEASEFLATGELTLQPITKESVGTNDVLMPETVCTLKKCTKHRDWAVLPVEEIVMEKQNAAEALARLKKKESQIRTNAEIRAATAI